MYSVMTFGRTGVWGKRFLSFAGFLSDVGIAPLLGGGCGV